jgi:hypothetical protein
MNERIRTLAEQADAYAWQLIDEGADYDKQPQYFAERFAELIIQECAGLTLDHRNADYYQGWLDYRDEIRQHWGIEP